MNKNSPVPANDQKETKNPFLEVATLENQLWALIHSKGLMQTEVQDLYRKACSSYEKNILNDIELAELQDVEYSLWKLHYKHIDEFRKCIRRNSTDSESAKSAQTLADVHNKKINHIEGFKSFLSEAAQFYEDLIIKLRIFYELQDDTLFYGSGGVSCSVEPTKEMHKCQFLCHRFLICLGDLERYRELYGKPDIKNHNWSAAVTYYLNASMTWPYSGHPQNQLAVLATYIDDEFLALYHCIRSLAVKEPFPDAWDNLMLLFEKNRSSCLKSLSSEAHFDFLNPSERSVVRNNLQSSDELSRHKAGEASEQLRFDKAELWSLFIRVISFFFAQSSLEDFPCTLASTMSELEALMELDDMKLEAALESYQHMDSARAGPFKALQVVSILIFVVQTLVAPTVLKKSKVENGMQQPVLTEMALTATFICMGRIVDRCLKSNPVESCPLLSAVLVYVEWLVGMLDKAETYGANEKTKMAVLYFFGTFVDLLNQLGDEKGEVKSPDHTALWEDYEFQGFAPVNEVHLLLNFSSQWDKIKSFENRKECRIPRIIDAGMKIANRSNNSQKWILFDESKKKFCMAGSKRISDRRECEVVLSSSNLEIQEAHQHICEATKDCEEPAVEEFHSSPSLRNEISVAMEEEEVILFNPLTRYNSVPLHSCITADDQGYLAGIGDQSSPHDECLRRASSALLAQAKSDPFTFPSPIPNFISNKPFKQQDSASTGHSSSETPIAAGPPSLSAWVLNMGSLNIEREKGAGNNAKYRLEPIEEIPSASLGGLSIGETEDSFVDSGNVSSPYLAPVPSAPLIPDDAVWFNGDTSRFSEFKSSGAINETNHFPGESKASGYSNWASTHRPLSSGLSVSHFMDGYSVSHGLTNSSQGIHQYPDNHNLDQNNSYMRPLHYYAPTNFGNSYGYDASRFGPFDRWGNPLASNSVRNLERPSSSPGLPPPPHGVDEERREKLFQNYQRPRPYGCGAMTDLRGEQQSLLQYLKEREWRMQQDPQPRSPTYMGN